MSQRNSPALELALAAVRAPGLLPRLRTRPLPEDMIFLLRIAAGDAHARELACVLSQEPEARVTEAAIVFIQQSMFYPGSDSYRVLGVEPDAPDAKLKEHYRWLVHWLHPDRHDDWDAVYADRVNRAWQDLRSPQRRLDYPRQHDAGHTAPSDTRRREPNARERPLPDTDGGLSTRSIRRLPAVILCSLAAAAFLLLGLQYLLLRQEAIDVVPTKPVQATARPAGSSRPAAPLRSAAPPSAAGLRSVVVAAPSPTARPSAPPPANLVARSGSVAAAMPARHAHSPGDDRESNSRAKAEDPEASGPATSSMSSPGDAAPEVAVELAANDVIPEDAVPSSSPASPVTARAPAAPSPTVTTVASPVRGDEALAREMILRFRSAYASGNINQVRSLLSERKLFRRSDRRAILKAYGELFESSTSRRIEIRNPSWLSRGDPAVLIARYDAWIVPRGETHDVHFTGDIRFDVRRENGQFRIVRLRHDRQGG